MNSGDLIGHRYRLDRKIGQGGTGRIWLAQDTRLDRSVAIKFLWARDPDKRARLTRRVAFEAKIAASIQHPSVVQIFDFGAHEDTPYIVMEALSGYTLGEAFDAAQSFSLDSLIHILSEVLRGLSAVHDAGIVHRDLKPDNIFLVKESRGKLTPKLLDFGISRSLDETRHSAVTTTEGLIVGTPQYMSPEQARGVGDIDKRTDIYSLGTIMFEALAGVVPFPARNISELLLAVITHEPQPLYERVPQIGEALCGVVDKALCKDRDQRYAHAAEMHEALLNAVRHVPATLDRTRPLFPPEAIKLRASGKAPHRPETPSEPVVFSEEPAPLANEPEETWHSPAARRKHKQEPAPLHDALSLHSDEPHAALPASIDSAVTRAHTRNAPTALRVGLILGALAVLGVSAAVVAVILNDRSSAAAGTGMIVVQAPPSAARPAPAPAPQGEPPATSDSPKLIAAEPRPSPGPARKPSAAKKPATSEDPMQRVAADVADAFSKQKARVIDCLNQHPDDIAGSPQLTVRVSLDAAGHVTGADVLPEAVANKPVVTCVRAVVRTMSFPRPGQPATFRVPLLWRRK